MKTFLPKLVLFAACAFIGLNADAKIKKEKPGKSLTCSDDARARSVNGANKHKKFAHLDAYNTPKSHRAIKHKVKAFEKPRHTLNLKFKSKKQHSSKMSSGGFYSFRHHGYTAHLFHKGNKS